MVARELEPNRKLFPDHISSILDDALVGAGSLWPIFLHLNMKCWNSAFNAQSSRVSIVIVQVGAMKIYVAAVNALKKKEIQDETQFTTKIGGKTSLSASYFGL